MLEYYSIFMDTIHAQTANMSCAVNLPLYYSVFNLSTQPLCPDSETSRNLNAGHPKVTFYS